MPVAHGDENSDPAKVVEASEMMASPMAGLELEDLDVRYEDRGS